MFLKPRSNNGSQVICYESENGETERRYGHDLRCFDLGAGFPRAGILVASTVFLIRGSRVLLDVGNCKHPDPRIRACEASRNKRLDSLILWKPIHDKVSSSFLFSISFYYSAILF